MGDRDVHGWIIAALSREIAGLEGQAMFECVESKFSFARCIRQGSAEAPRLQLKMATQILGNVEPEWLKKKMGVLMDNCEGQVHQGVLCGQTTTGSCLTQKRTWSRW